MVLTKGQVLYPFQDCFHPHMVAKATLFDGLRHTFLGMTLQQQQHPDELTHPCADAVLFFQFLA